MCMLGQETELSIMEEIFAAFANIKVDNKQKNND